MCREVFLKVLALNVIWGFAASYHITLLYIAEVIGKNFFGEVTFKESMVDITDLEETVDAVEKELQFF